MKLYRSWPLPGCRRAQEGVMKLFLFAMAVAAREIPAVLTGASVVSTPPVAIARTEAVEILAEAGMTVRFHGSIGQCRKRFGCIEVKLIETAPADLASGIMAQARFREGQELWIFLDRVRKSGGSGIFPRVLAHVIVHEIVHLTRRSSWHAESGIMKARWDRTDYAAMRRGRLGLTLASN